MTAIRIWETAEKIKIPMQRTAEDIEDSFRVHQSIARKTIEETLDKQAAARFAERELEKEQPQKETTI